MNEINLKQNHDEIDLIDLLDDIKSKWYWIVGATFIGIALAIVYAVLSTPVYETSLVYKRVAATELFQLNQPRLKESYAINSSGVDIRSKGEAVFTLSPTQALSEVKKLFDSGVLKRQFYTKLMSENNSELNRYIASDSLTEEQNFSQFSRKFKIISSENDSEKDADEEIESYVKISFELSDPFIAADILNRFGQFILAEYDKRVRYLVNFSVNSELEHYKTWEDSLRSSYRARTEQRMAQLVEAANIAASINQQQPFFSSKDTSITVQPPLYMMGEKALKKEIEQINNRNSTDENAYIKGMSELVWNIKFLEGLVIDWDSVQYVEIDQNAIPPLKPIKPRKAILLSLGTVFGFTLGVIFALLAAALSRRKERKLS
ncbi:MAG: Wzz/FepE/Etk N-terminal domain-containing protein [Oleibacter sp.]|nr:Wzz/FepE/Etk N-terminal domain-containing protein [Thalassolituus sp.]